MSVISPGKGKKQKNKNKKNINVMLKPNADSNTSEENGKNK